MLAFRNRFHGRGTIRTVLRTGRVIHTDYFSLKYTTNPRLRTPRFAVVVSKKVQKSAVGRNRIRRRVYELLRQGQTELDPQSEIVIIVTSLDVGIMPAPELKKRVLEALKRTHLYKTTEK